MFVQKKDVMRPSWGFGFLCLGSAWTMLVLKLCQPSQVENLATNVTRQAVLLEDADKLQLSSSMSAQFAAAAPLEGADKLQLLLERMQQAAGVRVWRKCKPPPLQADVNMLHVWGSRVNKDHLSCLSARCSAASLQEATKLQVGVLVRMTHHSEVWGPGLISKHRACRIDALIRRACLGEARKMDVVEQSTCTHVQAAKQHDVACMTSPVKKLHLPHPVQKGMSCKERTGNASQKGCVH
eukprot:1157216-Pelagomonas_calceolata.AAC.1